MGTYDDDITYRCLLTQYIVRGNIHEIIALMTHALTYPTIT